jgi:hypothetical protein
MAESPFMRASVVCLVGLWCGSAAAGPLADIAPPTRIVTCVPFGDREIDSIEIFRSSDSDLGLIVVSDRAGSSNAFVRLSFATDRGGPYLQAVHATRATDIGFTFFARLGVSQHAVLRSGTSDLKLSCDSAPTLASHTTLFAHR